MPPTLAHFPDIDWLNVHSDKYVWTYSIHGQLVHSGKGDSRQTAFWSFVTFDRNEFH